MVMAKKVSAPAESAQVNLVRRFEQLRRERDRQGRLERGRGDGDPFIGDPLVELVSECADGCNYAEAEMDRGSQKSRLQFWRYQAIDHHLRSAAMLALGALSDAGREDG